MFKASNGYTLDVGAGSIEVFNRAGETRHVLGKYSMDSLREFFRHERDEELGRWRWPDNPDFVVYPRGESGVHVLDEGSGIGAARFIQRNGDPHNPTAEYQAAYAYFEAHPERKPWHDAKTGEIWVITVEGEESAWTVNNEDRFENPDSTYELTNPHITAARRLWPESD
ncbi:MULTISPECIES: hypothetical protein [Microbacterium]|uniref:hypothetical protein n=1 Tax=Microbacterium TaxID=33882 RepID=UPI0028EAF81D|nr:MULTISPECIES: hypothetical protein [Microbacterium]